METEFLPYENTFILNLENEIWESVAHYDGVYEVSDLGRVRSLPRQCRNRFIEGRILKQNLGARNGVCSVKLSLDAVAKTFDVAMLVADAFMDRGKFEGKIVIHKNKIKHDNRLCNLILGTWSESIIMDYKLGVKEDWGVGNLSKDYRNQYELDNVVRSEGLIINMICQSCFIEKPSNDFYLRSETTYNRHSCKECIIKKMGIKDIGKYKNRKELASAGLRYCSICKELKNLDTDFSKSKKTFMGKSNTCKTCAKTLNLKYNQKRNR